VFCFEWIYSPTSPFSSLHSILPRLRSGVSFEKKKFKSSSPFFFFFFLHSYNLCVFFLFFLFSSTSGARLARRRPESATASEGAPRQRGVCGRFNRRSCLRQRLYQSRDGERRTVQNGKFMIALSGLFFFVACILATLLRFKSRFYHLSIREMNFVPEHPPPYVTCPLLCCMIAYLYPLIKLNFTLKNQTRFLSSFSLSSICRQELP